MKQFLLSFLAAFVLLLTVQVSIFARPIETTSTVEVSGENTALGGAQNFMATLTSACLNTPESGFTSFNSLPVSYTEYARSTNASFGISASNLGCTGWDVSGFTTSGSDPFIIASENWSGGSDGGLIYLALESGTQTILSLRFKSNDGKLFDLNSIDLGYDVINTNVQFTISGYRGGDAVSSATYSVPSFSSFGNGGNWSTAINISTNVNFQGIDEFRITPNTANQLTALDVDNINATNFRSATTPPTATTNAATSVSTAGATLNGVINANNAITTVTFEYGLTTGYGTIVTADQSPVTGSSATAVSKAISGLSASTTYHYRVVGVNAGGTTNGSDQTFTTSTPSLTLTSDATDNIIFWGTSVTFTATPSGSFATNYLWKKNGIVISGANSATYTTSDLVNGDVISAQLSANSGTIVNSNLVLHLDAGNQSSYPGSGSTWTDISGNSNNATLPSDLVTSYSSSIGAGNFNFNGSGSTTIQSNAINNWNVTSANALSVESWIKRTNYGNYQFWFSTPDLYYRLGVDPSGYLFWDMAHYTDRSSGIQISEGVWHHIAYTAGIESGNITTRIYLDGVAVASQNEGIPSLSSFTNYLIGDGQTPGQHPLNGNMGLIRVYNKTLSESEVSQNYNAELDRFSTNVLSSNSLTMTVNPMPAPTTQASAITFSSVQTTQMTIGWTNGNGATRTVFVKEGTGAITNPTDNSTYSASTDWASKGTQLGSSGYYCVYNNTGNSVTLTGLTASTQYTVQVFEYSGAAGSEKYYTATATDNPKSQSTCTNPTLGGTIAANQTGCNPYNPDEITSAELPTGHSGTLEYKWQSSTISSNSGFSDIVGSNAANYDPGSLTVDTWYKRLSRVDCMGDWIGAAESNVIHITVNSIPVDQTVSPTSQSICTGNSATISITSSETGTNYYLRDNSDNTVVDGPTAGTGSAISFSTGALTTSKTYNILAEKADGNSTALLMDGVNKYVSTPNVVMGNTWTYETLIKPNDISSIDWSGIITSNSGIGSGMWFQFSLNGSGKIRWESSDPGLSVDGIGPIINDNTWHHVAVTCDGTNIRFYTDGALQYTTAFTGGAMNRPLHIMAERQPNQFIRGLVDQTMVWNYARSLSEIQSDKTTTLTGSESGLLLYYTYEDGTGTTVTDMAGGDHNGTMMNMENEDWIANADPNFTNNACSVELTSTSTVSVSNVNTVSLSSVVGTDDQSTCINSAITEITYTTTGATGIGTVTNLPSGVSATWASNKITINGTPSESGTFNYSIPLEGGCDVANATGTITVNSMPDAPSAGSNSYTYDGTAKTAIANVGTGEVVDWYTNETGSTTSTAPSGTNVGTYSAYAETRNATTGCVSTSRTLITLEITKAVLTVTADDQTKIYGETNPTLTFQYSGWVNGVETIDSPPSISTTIDETSEVDTYANYITLSGGSDNNYTFNLISGDFEITKAMLTVTADDQIKAFGAANPTLTFEYSGWVNGVETIDNQPTITTTVDETTAIGNHIGVITASGAVDDNYLFNYVPGDFEITKSVLTVTAHQKVKEYGEANPPLTFSYSGWVNGVEEIDVPPTIYTNVDFVTTAGIYVNAIQFYGGSDNNYTFNFVYGNFEVYKANLNVTADQQTKVYGEENPELTYSVTGWKNADNLDKLIKKPVTGTIIDKTTAVGNYKNAITVAGGYDVNYVFTYTPADFNVTKAPLTITAQSTNKCYDGETFTGTNQVTYNGFVNNEDQSALGGTLEFSGTYASATATGTYTIVPEGLSSENYDILYQNGSLVINPLPTAIISGDAEICAGSTGKIGVELTGQAPWSFTYTDGIVSKTVNDIFDNSYSMDVTIPENSSKTYTITNVTDFNGCSNTAEGSATIKVKSTTSAGKIAGDQLIAPGTLPSTITSLNPGSGTGSITYAWESSINNGLNWEIIPEAIEDTYAPEIPEQETWFRRIAISTENNVACMAVTDPVKITLWPTGINNPGSTVNPWSAYAVRNTEIRIKADVGNFATARLYDIQGRLVLVKNLEKGSLNIIPTPNIKTGIYMLFVKDNERIQGFKIPVKE